MRRYAVVAVAVVGLGTSWARAQETPAQRAHQVRLMMILPSRDVQLEIKMTDAQIGKLADVTQQRTDIFKGAAKGTPEERKQKLEEADRLVSDFLAKTLTADQQRRIEEILLQADGLKAFERPEVVSALKLTAEQESKIKAVEDDVKAHVRDTFDAPTPKARAKKLAALQKSGLDRVVKEFTPEQRAKWKDMVGEPFEGSTRAFGARPPRRPK